MTVKEREVPQNMSLAVDYNEILTRSRVAAEIYRATIATLGGVSNHWNPDKITPGTVSDPAQKWLKELDDCLTCVGLIRQGRAVVDEVAQGLSVRHAEVLRLYYVEAVPTWAEVARRMKLSSSYIRRLKHEALMWLENGNNSIKPRPRESPRSPVS